MTITTHLPKPATPCAEVVESTTMRWTAQAWLYNSFPSFGSLVTVDHNNITIIGLVDQIKMGPQDSNRHPYAYQKTEEELRREQPHIFEFLSTTFSCLSLGFIRNKKIFYTISPAPPQIHAFVSLLSNDHEHLFLQHARYLHLIFNHCPDKGTRDELILSLIPVIVQLPDYRPLLTDLIHTYRMLSGNDYSQLKLFLERVNSML